MAYNAALKQFLQRGNDLEREHEQLLQELEDVQTHISRLKLKEVEVKQRITVVERKQGEFMKSLNVNVEASSGTREHQDIQMHDRMGSERTNAPVAFMESHLASRDLNFQTATPFSSTMSDAPNGMPDRTANVVKSVEDPGDTINVSPAEMTKKINTSVKDFITTANMNWYNLRTPKGIHENYGNVVFIDGNWTEVGCCICGKNAMYDKDMPGFRFFKHFSGMMGHVKSHVDAETGKDPSQVLKYLTRRVVSKEDVGLMRAGQEPKVPIAKHIQETMVIPPKRKTPTKHSSGMRVNDAGSPAKKPRVEIDGSPIAYRTPSHSEDDREALPEIKPPRS